MINHARTLLMNLNGSSGIFDEIPGEEIIEPTFRQLTLPTAIESARLALFGAKPDRYFRNYRCRQLLQAVHASRYAPYLLEFDPRVTYLTNDNPDLYNSSTFLPQAQLLNGVSDTAFFFSREPNVPDDLGQMKFAYDVTISYGSTVTVTRRTPISAVAISNYTLTEGLSNEIELPGSGYFFRFRGGVGSRWNVEILLRPVKGLPELLANLKQLQESAYLTLFGLQPEEPYKTFQSLWVSGGTLIDRLSGLLLALIYRTEEFRKGFRG